MIPPSNDFMFNMAVYGNDFTTIKRKDYVKMSLGRFGTPQKSRELLAPGDECPRCGKPMRVRTNKLKGTQFLGCSGYVPNDPVSCRYTEDEFRDARQTQQPSLFDKDAQQHFKAKLAARPEAAKPVAGTQSAPPQWPNQGLMLNEQECKRLLDVAHSGLKDSRDYELLDLICKLEEYGTKRYRKAEWEGGPRAEDLVPAKVNNTPQEEF